MNVRCKCLMFLFLLTTFLSPFYIYGQTKIQLESGVGLSFQNPSITVDGYKLKKRSTLTWRFGVNTQFFFSRFYFETGIFGIANLGRKELPDLKFKSYSLHAQIPFQMGYKFLENWQLSIGGAVQNERDFSEMNINKNHNIRLSFLSKVNYKYSNKLYFSFQSNRAIIGVPDVYALACPKKSLLLGITYSLF